MIIKTLIFLHFLYIKFYPVQKIFVCVFKSGSSLHLFYNQHIMLCYKTSWCILTLKIGNMVNQLFSCSPAVCWSAIWPLLHPFLCSKWRVHHPRYKLVQLRQPLEPQSVFCHCTTQSPHVSMGHIWCTKSIHSLIWKYLACLIIWFTG